MLGGEREVIMACLEHFCTVCDWYSCDNMPRHGPCPECGGRVATTFDEVADVELEDERDDG